MRGIVSQEGRRVEEATVKEGSALNAREMSAP